MIGSIVAGARTAGRSHRLTFLALVLAAMLIGPGCATLTPRECAVIDWAELGRADGVTGAPRERLARHVQSCAETGVTIDAAAYERGRAEGLATYCTPKGAYAAGRLGHRYQGVCTAPDDTFFAALNHGLGYYETRRDLSRLSLSFDPFPFGRFHDRRYGYPYVFERLHRWSIVSDLQRRLDYYSTWPPKAERP